MITYKKLTVAEAQEIYNAYMVVDFPPLELKPFKTIAALMEMDQYRCYGFYEGEQLTGYAFLCDNKEHTASLLDYYAIMADRRGQGYGQEIIRVLREIHREYDCLMLESENPDFAADEKELQTRKKRLHFYDLCGAKYAGFKGNTFDVEYVVLMLPCKLSPKPQETREMMLEIYRDLVKEPYFTEKVHIYDIDN